MTNELRTANVLGILLNGLDTPELLFGTAGATDFLHPLHHLVDLEIAVLGLLTQPLAECRLDFLGKHRSRGELPHEVR